MGQKPECHFEGAISELRKPECPLELPLLGTLGVGFGRFVLFRGAFSGGLVGNGQLVLDILR